MIENTAQPEEATVTDNYRPDPQTVTQATPWNPQGVYGPGNVPMHPGVWHPGVWVHTLPHPHHPLLHPWYHPWLHPWHHPWHPWHPPVHHPVHPWQPPMHPVPLPAPYQQPGT